MKMNLQDKESTKLKVDPLKDLKADNTNLKRQKTQPVSEMKKETSLQIPQNINQYEQIYAKSENFR